MVEAISQSTAGFVNYKQIVSDLTFDTVRACVNVVQVNEVVADVSHTMDGRVYKSSQSVRCLLMTLHHLSRLMIFR